MPPSSNLSSSVEPVVRQTRFLRSSRASAAVLKDMGTMVLTNSLSLLTLASEMPLTSVNLRTVAWAICVHDEYGSMLDGGCARIELWRGDELNVSWI